MLRNSGIALALTLAVTVAPAMAEDPAEGRPPKPAFDHAAALDALRASIKGREEEKSSTVFRNVQVLGDVPAGRLLKIMENSWSGALGVSCDHCHIPGRWEADDAPGKEIARDMAKMTRAINNELLASIEGLKSNPEKPVVNCVTCHRGQVRPATSMKQ